MTSARRPAPRTPRTAQQRRVTLFFAGMALFDVVIWTAVALAR